MINSVRNTVLSIANKHNFGSIPVSDFNLYAKQSQLDIFEDYFYRYTNWYSKQNQRLSGSGYADNVKKIEQVIDTFSKSVSLSVTTVGSDKVVTIPEDTYLINVVSYGNKELDKVSNIKLLNLLRSNLTAPSVEFPVYSLNADKITLHPSTIQGPVSVQYVRKPADPKWTYQQLSFGEPMFNQGAPDYMDFELPFEDEPLLVSKILQYIGISIREKDLYQSGLNQEINETQKEG